MKKFAVVGYGMMGATHLSILKKNPRAHVAALVENDPTKLKSVTQGNIGETPEEDLLKGVPTFTTIEKMLAATEVDCISICLPTHLHRRFVTQALEAGKHVICEKPMALSLEDCDAMIEAAERNQRRLFIAQCIRFWPEYEILKQFKDSGELGKPLSFIFRRVSASPFWAGPKSWFADTTKSGGCVFDLHVHDLDFINYLFGRPASVFSQGFTGTSGGNEAVMTQYTFSDGPMCFAEGSWAYPTGFKMAFTAVFEKGKLEYDSNASPALTLTRQGVDKPEPVTIPKKDGYWHEYEYFIDCLETGKHPEKMTLESARQSIEIANAEVQSMKEGKAVFL
ncbi:MAG: Gfo/Idh/MocA family oxidoreductase [Calditrichaeota bacterium]|nr:Gfo/Idh/MocA family oxidoreductase [Calditrichota bacterium]